MWRLKYEYARHKRPSKVGSFETEIERSVAIMTRLKWRCSQLARDQTANSPVTTLRASFTHARFS